MNKKLIAAAVSAAIVAPVAAYGEVQVYGRINNAIDLNDLADEGDSQTDVSAVSSRFGVKYNKEMGNGLSAHGRYEWDTQTDRENKSKTSGGLNDIRIATVGVSGSFGRIDVGNQWSAYNQTFGTLISPTYSLGFYIYSSAGGGLFRSSNTIKYSNSFGPVFAALDIRLNEEDSPESSDVAEKARGDGIGLGLSWAVNDNLTIAAAFDNEDGEDDDSRVVRGTKDVDVSDATEADGGARRFTHMATDNRRAESDLIGISAKGTFGGYWLSVGWQNHETDDLNAVVLPQDDQEAGADDDLPMVTAEAEEGTDTDTFFIYGGGKFSENTSWMLGYAEADVGTDDVNDDPEQFVWAIYHNLGGGLKLYYEAINVEWEGRGDGALDGTQHLLGMRVDF